jgi:competence protein ComEC
MKLTVIYLLSIIFLWINSWDLDYSKFKKGPSPLLVRNARDVLRKKYSDYKLAELAVSYITGDKRRLSLSIRRAHKRLGLYHLFTPSGIHLSAVIGMIFLFLKLLKLKSKKIRGGVLFLVCITPFFLPKMFSMKRISLMRSLFVITRRFKLLKWITPFQLFITSFIIDFFIGTYSSSPLSFSYSFLFLGIIMAVSEDKVTRLPFALLGGQVIIAYFQQSYLSFVGSFLGFGLTFIFTFFFPPLFILFWLELVSPLLVSEYLVLIYWKLVLFCSNVSSYLGEFEVSIWMVFLIIILSIKLKFHYLKYIVLLFVIAFHSMPIWNNKKYIAINRAKIRKNSKIYGEILNKKNTSRGFTVEFKSGKRCSHVLYEGGYSTSCKYKSKHYTRNTQRYFSD